MQLTGWNSISFFPEGRSTSILEAMLNDERIGRKGSSSDIEQYDMEGGLLLMATMI